MPDFWNIVLLQPLETLSEDLLKLLPNVLAMAIILSVGLVAAWGTGSLVQRLLRIIGLDHLSNSLGITAVLARGGIKADVSYLSGRAAYWSVALFATIAALSALNLQPINDLAQALLAYLPHLFTAALIMAAGYLLSNFISQGVLIAAVNAGLPPARLVAACSRWGVQLIAAAMALEQLGIARNIVVVGFGITLGGVVLAGAIAFGLGAKDLASQFLEGRLSPPQGDRGLDDLRHL